MGSPSSRWRSAGQREACDGYEGSPSLTPADVLTVVLLGTVALLLGVLAWRFRRGSEPELIQQQLIELRARLDALGTAQHELPRLLAENRMDQQRVLADQVAQFSGLVSQRIETAHATVGSRLDDTGRTVAEVRERLGQLAEVTRRLEAMAGDVAELQALLKVPQLRGTLGEVWLGELLRQVFPARLYDTQHTFRSGDRVDAVIKIGSRLVPVDAKFPLDAYQRMLASDGGGEERERRTFRRTLRDRIDEIAGKYILPEEGTYDFALMYIPAENVYYEAIVRGEELDVEGSVVAYAMKRKVIPVSPNTFYAYLSAILHGLRGLEVEESAREILDSLGGLQQQLARYDRAHDLIGTHLDRAVRQYDEANKQLGKIRDRFTQITGVGGGDVARPLHEESPSGDA